MDSPSPRDVIPPRDVTHTYTPTTHQHIVIQNSPYYATDLQDIT